MHRKKAFWEAQLRLHERVIEVTRNFIQRFQSAYAGEMIKDWLAVHDDFPVELVSDMLYEREHYSFLGEQAMKLPRLQELNQVLVEMLETAHMIISSALDERKGQWAINFEEALEEVKEKSLPVERVANALCLGPHIFLSLRELTNQQYKKVRNRTALGRDIAWGRLDKLIDGKFGNQDDNADMELDVDDISKRIDVHTVMHAVLRDYCLLVGREERCTVLETMLLSNTRAIQALILSAFFDYGTWSAHAVHISATEMRPNLNLQPNQLASFVYRVLLSKVKSQKHNTSTILQLSSAIDQLEMIPTLPQNTGSLLLSFLNQLIL